MEKQVTSVIYFLGDAHHDESRRMAVYSDGSISFQIRKGGQWGNNEDGFSLRFNLQNMERVIAEQIKFGSTQKGIAKTYAVLIEYSYKPDWTKLNELITTRWSRSGLETIKKMAWQIVEDQREQQ